MKSPQGSLRIEKLKEMPDAPLMLYISFWTTLQSTMKTAWNREIEKGEITLEK